MNQKYHGVKETKCYVNLSGLLSQPKIVESWSQETDCDSFHQRKIKKRKQCEIRLLKIILRRREIHRIQ